MKLIFQAFVYIVAILASHSLEAQTVSVSEYLEKPNLVNMRMLARQSPQVLGDLISAYQGASTDDVRISCLRAINASVEQTEQSKDFIEQLAGSNETPSAVKDYANFGDVLNQIFAAEKNNEEQENNEEQGSEKGVNDEVEPRLLDFHTGYSRDVIRVGDRSFQLLQHASKSSDHSRMSQFIEANGCQAEFDELMTEKMEETLEEIIAKEDVCTRDEFDQIWTSMEFASFGMKDDRVFRRGLTKTLSEHEELPHFGVETSRRMAIIHGCLAALKTDRLKKTDFDKLITLVPRKIFEEGRDEETGLRFMGTMRDLVSRFAGRESIRSEGDEYVDGVADQFALAVISPYLALDLAESRAPETQLLARQCMEYVSLRHPQLVRNVYIETADGLLKSGDEREFTLGLELLQQVKPETRHVRLVENTAFGLSDKVSACNRAKAAVVLAGWSQVEEDVAGDAGEAIEKTLRANFNRFTAEQKRDLASDYARHNPLAGLELILEILANTESKEDKLSLIYDANGLIEPNTYRDRELDLDDISTSRLAVLAPHVFDFLGAMEETSENDMALSLSRALAYQHRLGRKVLEKFIDSTNNETAKILAAEILLDRLGQDVNNSIARCHDFRVINPTLDVFNRQNMNLYDSITRIGGLVSTVEGGSAAVQHQNLTAILESHDLAMTKIKSIAADPKHELYVWAKEVIDESKKEN